MSSIIYTNRQLRNDEKNLKAIADEYEGKISHRYWLAEALQKDAIQNGWDAKRGREWAMRFELMGNRSDFLVIQDFYTSGLSGTIWKDQEELASILENEGRTENLAHFLSSDFSTKTAESGGKRGRGKSLFLFTSKNLIFYFDSQRATNDYVAGSIFIGSDKGAKVEMTSGNSAINYMKEKIGEYYSPITINGTRVFIKNPQEEVVSAIRDGSMLNFIEKNWWEIIKKYDAHITVFDGIDMKQASVPFWYQESLMKERGLEPKEYPNLKLPSVDGKKYPVKRIFLVYNPAGDTPESFQGISIQRKGMSIERRPTETLVKEDGMSKVYGWVEMEPELEYAMYDLEDVEHLGFIWTKKPAKDLLDLIKIQIRDFAKGVKLIESELSKEHKVHKQVEDDIAKKINNFLKNVGFSGVALTKRKRKGKKRMGGEMPLRISLADFRLNCEGRRVNYGDVIKAVSVAINDLEIPIQAIHRTWIVDGDGKVIKTQEEEIDLYKGISRAQGWERLKISQEEFPKGDYSFRSKLILLKDTDEELPRIGRLEKGKEIIVSTAFSVDKDPKSQGFIKFEPVSDKNKERYITTRPEADVLIVEYNTQHPYINNLMPVERAADLGRFLLETGIIAAFNQVMAEDRSCDEPKIFADVNDNYDLAMVVPRIMEEVSKFMWQQ